MCRQSATSKEISDLVLEWFLENENRVPEIVHPFGHPDMIVSVCSKTKRGKSKSNSPYKHHLNHSNRVVRALRQDKRFTECRIDVNTPKKSICFRVNKEMVVGQT